MTFDLTKRVAVLEAVASKYNMKPLTLGSDDCVHMIAYGLNQYGLKTSLLKYGSYSTPAGAKRALLKAGFADLPEAVAGQGFWKLDAAALAWPGDIIALKAETGDDVALAWMASNGRAFGFWNGCAQYFQPLAIEAAWRVAP